MKRKIIWGILLSMTLGACNQIQGVKDEMVSPEAEAYGMAATGEVAADATAVEGKSAIAPQQAEPQKFVDNGIKIVRTGNLSLESKDINSSKQNLDQLVKRFQGYYEEESANNTQDFTSYNLIIRIPSTSFDQFLTAISSGSDKVTSKTISASDVSMTYFDLASRLKSKRAYLEKYQAMVASAKNVKELLEIQEQIRQLQEDIDSSESLMRNMNSQIKYSTLTINLFEYQANLPMGTNSFWVQLKDALAFGMSLIRSIVLGIIGLWPIWIVTALAVWIVLRIRRTRKAKSIGQ